MFALSPSRKLLVAAVCAAGLSTMPTAAFSQDDDPPPEAGRISYISGNVSIQTVTSEEWGQAYPNLPLGPGDRIYTDSNGRAEIQVGRTYIRIAPNSDVTLVDDSQFNINLGVAQGSVRLHSFGLWPRQLLDVSTPNGNAEFGNSGDLRVDVLPSDGATVFTNLGQFADITAAGNFRQELNYGQSLEVAGTNPVYPQWLQPAAPDDLDYWSQQRDQRLAQVSSFQYVSPDVPGAVDLDAYGDWQPETEYGAVWFPRSVPADWAPYHNGHWINRPPWGWVWVEDESWGYAPFHYGRWVFYRNRWGWVPGPVNVRPVWSPALVVFAGGGSGISLWFPLGPGEPYRPWYRCSPGYIDRVNITNIREAPRVHVQNTYVNIVNVTNITYVNQTRGAIAVRHDDFASGRSVRTVAVRVDPRDIERARPLQRPDVAPTPRAIISRPVARPVPVSIQRPVLINQQGRQIAARPGAAPVAPPVRSAPVIKPLPGRTVIAAPARPGPNRPNVNQPPQQTQGDQNRRVTMPTQPYPGGAPRATPVAPVQGIQRGIEPQQPNQDQQRGHQSLPPTGRPVPPNYQQDRVNPGQDTPNNPPNPVQNQPNRTPDFRNNRPNTPDYQQQRPNPPQQPSNQDRRDSNPVQPDRNRDARPQQPYNPPQARPVPPPPAQERPAPPQQQPRFTPPPAPNRSVEQPRNRPEAAPPQNRPKNNDQKPNKPDKQDDKKHD